MHGAFPLVPLYVGDVLEWDRPVLVPPYLEVDVHAHRAGEFAAVIIVLTTVNRCVVKAILC